MKLVSLISILALMLMVGCRGDDVVTPTETEVPEPTVSVIDIFDGKNIYFELSGITYEGRVVEGVSADEVLVRVTAGHFTGSDMIINVDRIGGTLLADQPEIDTEVLVLIEYALPEADVDDLGVRDMVAIITAVYSNGMCKLRLLGTHDAKGKWVRLTGIYFVHEDTDFESGGYRKR